MNFLKSITLPLGFILLFWLATGTSGIRAQTSEATDFSVTKPLTRWWWFADKTDTNDIQAQLDWALANEFGGVEIAWVYPQDGDSAKPRDPWLSSEWSRSVHFAKKYAETIGLACDFTFGTLWPFGDSKVPVNEGSVNGPNDTSQLTMRLTWEHPKKGRVINHLDQKALKHYGHRMVSALRPSLLGAPSALFCDSWEVDTRTLWTPGFDDEFHRRFGYNIVPYLDSLYLPGYEAIYYDYMTVLSDYVLYDFYGPFTNLAHRYNAFSRVQCGGSPTDLLTAFSLVDIPETEALLYEPSFALIPASAALLTAKPLVSAEAFTCLYGWKGWPGPGPHQGEEQIADIKLVADALFAHGVNMIVWHGMPFNAPGDSNRFYASVHIGPDAGFALELPPFNQYLSKVTRWMRTGKPYATMASYIPLEESWMGVEYPDSLQLPWAWGEYELRYVRPAEEIRGYQPFWINQDFLLSLQQNNAGQFVCGDATIESLYIDVSYMEFESLRWIHLLAQSGLPVCLKQDPLEPGTQPHPEYPQVLHALKSLPNVSSNLEEVVKTPPLVSGETIPDFRCRVTPDALFLFFANPNTSGLKYPMQYGQSFSTDTLIREITVNHFGKEIPVTLTFEPYQSVLLKIPASGDPEILDIEFVPSPPTQQ
jgi:hypothetical protein